MEDVSQISALSRIHRNRLTCRPVGETTCKNHCYQPADYQTSTGSQIALPSTRSRTRNYVSEHARNQRTTAQQRRHTSHVERNRLPA